MDNSMLKDAFQQPIEPVTPERIRTVLTACNVKFTEERDVFYCDPGMSGVFALWTSGDEPDTLIGHALSDPLTDIEESLLVEATIDWNRSKFWPKAYVQSDEDGLFLAGDLTFPIRGGLTNAQLADFVDCILTSSMSMMEQVIAAGKMLTSDFGGYE